jgi:hypothetical protein
MRYACALVAAAVLAGCGAASAADPRFPDWPCRQIKVPELSVAAIWAGPPIDDVGKAWEDDVQVSDLVARLAARRTPLDEAEKAAAVFVTADPRNKETRGKLLFAGLFATLNRERTTVMDGIERYAQRQKAIAAQIRAKAQQVRDLSDRANHDEKEIDDLGNAINWDRRVFEERRKTVGYVCEVPTLIEQRLGALARAIAQAME